MSDEDLHSPAKPAPKISFASALGEAGHEVADLGIEGVADDGPLLERTENRAASDDDVIDALGKAVGGLHDDPSA